MSFVESSIILCTFIGRSTIGGSTVVSCLVHIILCISLMQPSTAGLTEEIEDKVVGVIRKEPICSGQKYYIIYSQERILVRSLNLYIFVWRIPMIAKLEVCLESACC